MKSSVVETRNVGDKSKSGKELGKVLRKKRRTIKGDLPPEKIDELAKILAKQVDAEIFEKKYAPVREVLKMVGAGAFLAASVVAPGLPRALKPFRSNSEEYDAFKRFNIPYLKQTLKRLERQKLVEIGEEEGVQVIKITEAGRQKILRFALDELAVEKPKYWDGKWYLVSYDIPEDLKFKRMILNEYLRAWGFYPIHQSVFLHAYPCEDQVEFLREYLGVGDCVRIFTVTKIENDRSFRTFFGV